MCMARVRDFSELSRVRPGMGVLSGWRSAVEAAPEPLERGLAGSSIEAAESALAAEEREALLLSLAPAPVPAALPQAA
jgi:hypothetical protein